MQPAHPTPRRASDETRIHETGYAEVSNDRLAEEIDAISAEGRPAHPEAGPGRITLYLLLASLLLLVVGLAATLTMQPVAGLVTMGVAVLLFLSNPVIWVAIIRAVERARAKDRIIREDAGATEPRGTR